MLICWMVIAMAILGFAARCLRAMAEPDDNFRLPPLWYWPHALGLWVGVIGLLLS